MSLALHTAPLAFRRGQLDALGRAWLSCPALYSAEMRACLALRTLGRAWVQYREDRAIATGENLIGAENADVTIIGFVDYNCPYCKKMQPEIDGLLKADPKVRVLYKDWPIFGDVSETAARTALAAGYQGKYEAVHNAFMLSPSRIGDQADITRLVQSAGVDMARLNQDLADHRADIDAVLDRNGREAAALALQGTPAFIINGNLIPGGMPQAQLEAVIGRIRSGQPLR